MVNGTKGIRDVVASGFALAARRHDRQLEPLRDGLLLEDSGLDSLCLIEVFEHLEAELGIDPVAHLDATAFPRSFGDIVRLCEFAVRKAGSAVLVAAMAIGWLITGLAPGLIEL
jgi:hypothetical protein